MNQVKLEKFIAKLRKDAGLTQEAFGKELGVTNKTVSRWETGLYMPPTDILLKISQMFNISVNEILNGERINEVENLDTLENHFPEESFELDQKNQPKRNAIRAIISIFVIIAIFCVEKLLTDYGTNLMHREFLGYFYWINMIFIQPIFCFIIGSIIAYNIKRYTSFTGNRIAFRIELSVSIALYLFTVLCRYDVILVGIFGLNQESIARLPFNIPFSVTQFIMTAAPIYYILGFVVTFFKKNK